MSEDSATENYYSILNCTEYASYEELKQNYQELIRKYHPDKSDRSPEHFLNIDKAWKTLRDKHSRNQYNNQLQMQADDNNVVIHAQINKSELNFSNTDVISYPCRCGSSFDIDRQYLSEETCLVECNECSNCIIIK